MNTSQVAPPTISAPSWIDFRQLTSESGAFSELFYDFMYDFGRVERFFPHNFRDSHSFEALLERGGERDLDRKGLVSILLDQNNRYGASDETVRNIKDLEDDKAFAVVTGQQVGLFGGPLYTVFKAITAIKLAEHLRKRHPEHKFIPVFWLEGEDHDFEEVNNIIVLNGDGLPAKIEYTHGGDPGGKNLGPVGDLRFHDSLESTISNLEENLRKTEYTPAILKSLREAYAPGRTFLDAFVSWMNRLLGEFGLVFLSSHDRQVKQRLSPLFEKELTEYPSTSQNIIRKSAELEEHYHAQIKPKSVNLFMFHKGGRYLIEPRENDFSLRGTRHFIPKDDMLEIARKTPELLSPNVALRPVAQDSLLPTVAYVAGPAEVAYHGQLGLVYEDFGVTQPIIYPRASGTFLEERAERLMSKFQLEFTQLMEDPTETTKQVLKQIAGINVDTVFEEGAEGLTNVLGQIEFALHEIDPTLLGALKGVRSKMEGNLNGLKEKAFSAQKRRNETALRQLEKGINTILPNGRLQEREISILYYMNKYGPDLVKWLKTELDITGFKHQIITV